MAPSATYARLLAERASDHPFVFVRRPVLVALVIGTAVSMSATGHPSVESVVSVTLCWSVAVAVQMLAGWVLVRSSRLRGLTVPQAMDLLFMGHLPWSVWLLAAGGYLAAVPTSASIGAVLLSVVVPMFWTARLLTAFCRTVLGASPRHARLQALLHQSIVWGIGLVFFVVAIGGWDRLLSEVGL
jgi:hypothetical protein